MKIEDFNFAGHKAIVRVDFNVPLDEKKVALLFFYFICHIYIHFPKSQIVNLNITIFNSIQR